MRDSCGRLSLALSCLCAGPIACGDDGGGSASASASTGASADPDTGAGTAMTSAGSSSGPTSDGEGDASTADAPTSEATLTGGGPTGDGPTSAGPTSDGDTTDHGETSVGDTTDATSDTGDTTDGETGDDSTSTGGVDDPWDCEGGDPVTVNGAGKYATLAAAVAAAPPNATITVCAGTYMESVIIDRPMTLIGAGQDKTFLDGGGAGTPILIDAVDVTIEGFTFQHGEAEHNPLGNSLCGGALAIQNAAGAMLVTIADCTFKDNHGQMGGAICYDGSGNDDSLQRLVLEGVTITGNSADSNGGGLFSYSSTTMTDTTIVDNTAGAQGGGIYFSYSDNVVVGGIVKQNTAEEGGGMFLQSPVTVDVMASDWGFGMDQENVPNDVQHYANEYGFFGAGVSFFCEYIEWNMGMCALK